MFREKGRGRGGEEKEEKEREKSVLLQLCTYRSVSAQRLDCALFSGSGGVGGVFGCRSVLYLIPPYIYFGVPSSYSALLKVVPVKRPADAEPATRKRKKRGFAPVSPAILQQAAHIKPPAGGVPAHLMLPASRDPGEPAQPLPALSVDQTARLQRAKQFSLKTTVEHRKLEEAIHHHVMMQRHGRIPPDAPLPPMVLSGLGVGSMPLLPGGPIGMMVPGPGGMLMPQGMMMPPMGGMPGFQGGAAAAGPPPGSTPEEYKKHQEKERKRRNMGMMARVYVGSIGYLTNKETLHENFKVFGAINKIDMPVDLPPPGMPVKHKGFAFVEYEYPESAQLAIAQMNSAMVDGRPIKVNTSAKASNGSDAESMVADMAGDEANKKRIFVSSIHMDLSTEEFQSIFDAFGTITSCKLCPAPQGSTDKHQGYGYIEFADEDSVKEALTFNMFDLGGLHLRVCQAITTEDMIDWMNGGEGKVSAVDAAAGATGEGSAAGGVGAAAAGGGMPGAGMGGPGGGAGQQQGQLSAVNELDSNGGNISGTTARYLMMQKLAQRGNNSLLMVIKDMVLPDEVDEELEEELMEGFGQDVAPSVEKMNIIVEKDEGWVKIFVLFKNENGLNAGIAKMDQRKFDGRIIKAHVYNQAQFDSGDYTS